MSDQNRESFGRTINLVNSAIGVSLLSMPFCFKKCGIVLSVVLILLSAVLNRFCCYLLLKSAVIAKRRNYELLAFHTFGRTGKLLVELSVLGFLLGTCIAFFVVIGDIGPSLVSHLFGVTNGPQLRAFVMTFLGMFVALPLGLLRRVDSLTSLSMLSLGLYIFVVLKMFSEAMANIGNNGSTEVWEQINYWDTSHVLSSAPIFSMALSCQTQLFSIFESSLLHSNDSNTLNQMRSTVNRSLNICSAIYISVGICGYLAFCGQPFGGNILIYLPSGFVSTFTLIAFVFTVLVSFPLCLFPCRTSLHSLLSRKGTTTLLNTASPSIHMSDQHFRLLTVTLIVITIGISILLPYIEFVLGLLGSTIGAVICFIFPALIFLSLTTKNTTERLSAQLVVMTGIFILIICTFSTLHEIYFVKNPNIIENLDLIKTSSPKPLSQKQFQTKNSIDVQMRPTAGPTPRLHPILNDLKVPLPSMNANKVRRQEELLQRLEKQQLEHKKLLEQQKELFNDMKIHNQMFHSLETNKLVIESKVASNGTDSKDKHSINYKELNPIISNNNVEKNLKSNEKPLVYLTKMANNLTKDSIFLINKPLEPLSDIKHNSLNKSQEKREVIKSKDTEKEINSKIEPKLDAIERHSIDEKNVSNVKPNPMRRNALSQ